MRRTILRNYWHHTPPLGNLDPDAMDSTPNQSARILTYHYILGIKDWPTWWAAGQNGKIRSWLKDRGPWQLFNFIDTLWNKIEFNPHYHCHQETFNKPQRVSFWSFSNFKKRKMHLIVPTCFSVESASAAHCHCINTTTLIPHHIKFFVQWRHENTCINIKNNIKYKNKTNLMKLNSSADDGNSERKPRVCINWTP